MSLYSHDIETRIRRICSELEPAPSPAPGKATAVLSERMQSLAVPGVSMAVINDGQVEWARGFGTMEYGGASPVTPETLFQAASISKSVAALITLRLVTEGVLDLDEDVNNYLKSWKVPKNGEWQPRLTLRQLMSHGAGTTVHGFPGYPNGTAIPNLPQVLSGQHPANTKPVMVDTLPGVQYRYSGGGTSIMQFLLTDVTGLPFAVLARELVLDPLGMENSMFEQPLPEEYRGAESAGHSSRGETIAGRWHIYPEQAAAGLWTTPTDLCKMVLSIQRARAGIPHSFLSRKVIDEALVSQNDGSYGLGFRLEGTGENLRFGHTGSNAGFRCIAMSYADHGIGACIMTNGDNGSGIYTEVMASIARVYGWPGYAPQAKRAHQLAEGLPEHYEGSYELKPGYCISIRGLDNGLLVSIPGQDPIRYTPVSDILFCSDVVNTAIRFEWTRDHQVSGVYIEQNGSQLPAWRVR